MMKWKKSSFQKQRGNAIQNRSLLEQNVAEERKVDISKLDIPEDEEQLELLSHLIQDSDRLESRSQLSSVKLVDRFSYYKSIAGLLAGSVPVIVAIVWFAFSFKSDILNSFDDAKIERKQYALECNNSLDDILRESEDLKLMLSVTTPDDVKHYIESMRQSVLGDHNSLSVKIDFIEKGLLGIDHKLDFIDRGLNSMLRNTSHTGDSNDVKKTESN